jgi:hypothetical protein
MGLFSKAPVAELDPQLEQAILAADARLDKMTRKLLAKSQLGILATVEPNEKVVTILGQWEVASYIIALTNKRILKFRGPKLDRQLSWSDIANVRGGAMPNGHFAVVVESHTAVMYPVDDNRRYNPDESISLEFGSPQMAKDVSLIIKTAIQ